MTRPVNNPKDETKVRILMALKRYGNLRFGRLAKFCGYQRNHTTLSQCLKHLSSEQVSQIEHDTRTREYSITAKGLDELDRITIARQLKRLDFHLTDNLESPSEFKEPQGPSGWEWEFEQILHRPPLPVPVNVTLFGSDKAIFGDTLSWLRWLYPNLRPRKLAKAMLAQGTRFLAWRILSEAILNRVYSLSCARAHDNRGGSPRRRLPSALTLDDVLDFDMLVTIRYEGKKLMKSETELGKMVDERNVKDPIMKRFVAFLLLELYESMRLGTSLSEVIAILESLNFIGKKDLEIIKRGGLLKIAIGNLIDVGILRVPAEKDIDTLARFAEKSLSAESGPPASFRLFAEESER